MLYPMQWDNHGMHRSGGGAVFSKSRFSPPPGDANRSAIKMMTPRAPIEVARLIASGRWKAKHIAAYRSQFGEGALLDVLLCPFLNDCSTETLTHYDCQQPAGVLLLELMPEFDRALQHTIRRSLPLWNVSVEQWPFYLCRCFGIDAVTNAIAEIAETENLDENERCAIETLRWLLGGKPDIILGTQVS
ncbi:hypothetical protein [Rubripirellula tenax]|nr:hypothetical protein [Rubripirellula tenax]